MDVQGINNFFGDMDLFLMDSILKGYVKPGLSVLDVGCGEGRNGIYFIQQHYEYHGWDIDDSKLKLLEYLVSTLEESNTTFRQQDLRNYAGELYFDFIICSRVLHFAKSESDFLSMWKKLSELLKKNGLLYVCMDSIVDTTIATDRDSGLATFPDGKIRFALTSMLYQQIKEGFEEVEPLKTLIHHKERAQSFLLLRKI